MMIDKEKTMSGFRRRILGLLLAAGALSGCATRTDVIEAVSASNAALLGPELQQGGVSGSQSWKDAVQKLEKLIEEHPDQKKMNAALRVRQAMILTVNRSKAMATETWTLAEKDANLLGERDKCLVRLSSHLVWWFDRAMGGPFKLDDSTVMDRINGALQGLQEECAAKSIPEDLRMYLATMRSLIALKVANSMPNTSDAEKKALASYLADGLAAYADRVPEDGDDGAWIKTHYSKGGVTDEDAVATLRRRFDFIHTTQAYRDLAKRAKVDPPWRPPWVARLIQANP